MDPVNAVPVEAAADKRDGHDHAGHTRRVGQAMQDDVTWTDPVSDAPAAGSGPTKDALPPSILERAHTARASSPSGPSSSPPPPPPPPPPAPDTAGRAKHLVPIVQANHTAEIDHQQGNQPDQDQHQHQQNSQTTRSTHATTPEETSDSTLAATGLKDLKALRDPAQQTLAPRPQPVAAAAALHPHSPLTSSHDLLVLQPASIDHTSRPASPLHLSPTAPLSSPPSPHLAPSSLSPLSSAPRPCVSALPALSAQPSASFAPSFAAAAASLSSFAPALPPLPTLPCTVYNPEEQLCSQPSFANTETYTPPLASQHDHSSNHGLDHGQDSQDHPPKMIFSDLYKSPKSPFAKLRRFSSSQSRPPPPQRHVVHAEPADYGDPDLICRDKTRQKDAVRRFLENHIRNDWDFTWPPEHQTADAIAKAQARAAAIRLKIVQIEQVGLLQPGGTFASPMLPNADGPESTLTTTATTTTVSLAEISAAVASAADDYETDSDSDAESIYSTVSEDADHLRPRIEWTSDFSDDDRSNTYYQRMPVYVHSPFRFESPDAVGGTASKNASPEERKAKARRDERAEMAWNDGLACFQARRNAWTGAHTVRVKPAQPVVLASPAAPRRGLFRFHSHSRSEPVVALAVSAPTTPVSRAVRLSSPPPTTPLSPVMSNSRHSQYSEQSQLTQLSQQSHVSGGLDTVATTPATSDDGLDGAGGARLQQAKSHPVPLKPTRSRATQGSSKMGLVQHTEYAVETLIPVAPPLLPPANPMRQSITPALYLSLYDKLVLGMTAPSCPINLSDMIRSCVAGWKRDNEWPPRAEPVPAPPTVRIQPSVSASSAAARRRKDGRSSPGGALHRMRLLSKQPTVVSPTTTPATVGAAPAKALTTVGGDGDDDSSNHGIRRSLQRVLGLNHGQTHPVDVGHE